jgi:hypothetical protein
MSKKKTTAKVSKNDMSNRGKKATLRTWNGKTVVPVLYQGLNSNKEQRKRFMAFKYQDSGEIVLDKSGLPIPYEYAYSSSDGSLS